jgi:transglutaminase-like putative cysteine protease
MQIRVGYSISVACEQSTPAILKLEVHPDREPDILQPLAPSILALGERPRQVETTRMLDIFGNRTLSVVFPEGQSRIFGEGLLNDPGIAEPLPGPEDPLASPHELLAAIGQYLAPSRFCESDLLSDFAWKEFGQISNGADKVRAVCNLVHDRITFGYQHARMTRTAAQGMAERIGVCRDFAHLAIAFCRGLNIPARYVTGFLGDIGVPPDTSPMDFSAWFEVYLGNRWWSFDARHNVPRIGRIVMARGRDAADVAMISTFGAHTLTQFEIVTREVMVSPPKAVTSMVMADEAAARSMQNGHKAAA